MALELAKLGHEVTGVDLHQYILLAAQSHAREAGVSIVCIQGELLKAPKLDFSPLERF
jgi:2-polyprenyl-3-methyl-5-hydroxy-6-metoxy-1,4-benzoquinol methylase